MASNRFAITLNEADKKALLERLRMGHYNRQFHQFHERIDAVIEGRARQNAPVDTGRLRSSIDHEIESAAPPLQSWVGTNVEYAGFMEYGTGSLAEGDAGKGAWHFPPGEALDVWASRHGFENGYQVAAIIKKRGGLKPTRFLRDAVRDSESDFGQEIDRLGAAIAERWQE